MSSIELKDSLIQEIHDNGYVTIASYIEAITSYYYSQNEAIGDTGDFITAPEISQMFAEILAAYIGNYWLTYHFKKQFTLLECGPGKGTLSDDLLRVAAGISSFNEYMDLYLLETSPRMIECQRQLLGKYHPKWISNIQLIENMDKPLILLANEFLDALPIHQLIYKDNIWHEKVITYSDAFSYEYIKASETLLSYIPKDIVNSNSIEENSIFEISPARITFLEKACSLIKKNSGVAIFIDYGHKMSAFGDTIQTVKNHQYSSLFDNIGTSDVTSHVDFDSIKNVAKSYGLEVSDPIYQGEFLIRMGLLQRAEKLCSNATSSEILKINSQVDRLCSPKKMGHLFKVLIISSETIIA
jgi:NADH dehydrogenase [ubiquinone] 1 alpha subcomplex assembly factor 7